MKHLRYAHYILRHKFFVFHECWKLGLYWQGITHDLSKLLPSEWRPYAEFFYAKGARPHRGATGDAAFDFAWLLHQKRNRHHWQWWILPEASAHGEAGELKVLPMPLRYRREMLCDWRGAGRALKNPDTKAWWKANKAKMTLHPTTRQWLEEQLGEG